MRAPNVDVVAEGGTTSLYQLWKGSTYFHVLYIDLKKTFSDLEEQARNLEAAYPGLVRALAVSAPTDFHDQFKTHYADLTIYCIRPDGYVGYCGPLEEKQFLESYLRSL